MIGACGWLTPWIAEDRGLSEIKSCLNCSTLWGVGGEHFSSRLLNVPARAHIAQALVKPFQWSFTLPAKLCFISSLDLFSLRCIIS